MASLYLILTSLIFPVLAISWLCCIACCIYRSLLRNLNKPGRRTKIQVLVTDRRDSTCSAEGIHRTSNHQRSATITSSTRFSNHNTSSTRFNMGNSNQFSGNSLNHSDTSDNSASKISNIGHTDDNDSSLVLSARNGILGHRHENYENGTRGIANDRNIVDSEANELPGSVRNTNTNSDTTGQTPSSGYNFSSRLSQMRNIASRTLRGRQQSANAVIRPATGSEIHRHGRGRNKVSNGDSALNTSLNRGRPVPHSSRFAFSNNDLSSSTSSQPVYYPKYHQSLSESSKDPLHQSMSPTAPLHPPWRSQLPPIQRQTSELDK